MFRILRFYVETLWVFETYTIETEFALDIFGEFWKIFPW